MKNAEWLLHQSSVDSQQSRLCYFLQVPFPSLLLFCIRSMDERGFIVISIKLLGSSRWLRSGGAWLVRRKMTIIATIFRCPPNLSWLLLSLTAKRGPVQTFLLQISLVWFVLRNVFGWLIFIFSSSLILNSH